MRPRRPAACTSPRRVLAALLVLIACGQTAAGASPQGGPAPQAWDRIGVGTHLVWSSAPEAETVFRRVRSGGIQWVREDFPWGTLEPSRGSYDWERTDALMTAAAVSGIDVLAILDYSTRWASSDPSGAGAEHFAPRDAADYAAFAAAVVGRYGRNGSFWSTRPDLTPRPLAAVEIWNEPYGYWFWKPDPNPAAYARLARATATAIKATHPEVKILISGEVWQARRDDAAVPWLARVLDADSGLAKLVDGYSLHPYPWPRNAGPYDTSNRWSFDLVQRSREIAAARHAALPIWITEIGWSTADLPDDGVSEATQAAYVRQAMERAFGEWGSYVERVFFYSFDRSNTDVRDREGNYGLLRADDSFKPAWHEITRYIDAAAGGSAPARVRARIVMKPTVFSRKLVVRGRVLSIHSPRAAKRRVLLLRFARSKWRLYARTRTNGVGTFKLVRKVRPSVRALRLVAVVRHRGATVKSPVATVRRR